MTTGINSFGITQYYRYLITIFLIIKSLASSGQDFSGHITSSQLDINGKNYSGYVTHFPFPDHQVSKGLWSYYKSFARVYNQRTHYVIKIAPERNEGNVEIVLVAQIIPEGLESDFHIALKPGKLNAEIKKQYQTQLRTMVLDFKQQFFVDHFQRLIDEKIARSNKLGKQYEKMVSKKNREKAKTELLKEIGYLQLEIENLKKKQSSVLD